MDVSGGVEDSRQRERDFFMVGLEDGLNLGDD